jgi:pyridoxal/pyridoxine/pyridoxamine kinase
MLERYYKALDLEAFEAAAYGPQTVVVRSRVEEVPPDALVMSLEQAQQWLEIVPRYGGSADGLGHGPPWR